ncbi:peptide deformylase [Entomobacter blattae]|nr:peptide deformylase [Entomobacter blattae]
MTHQDQLQILTVPHPVLRKKAERITEADYKTVSQILPSMFSSMYQAQGIGLAAPQVGISLRFFVIDLMRDDTADPRIFINPEIISFSEEINSHREGCLSIPDQFEEVTRPAAIKVRFQDEKFNLQELEADGLLATCIQHELDHLDGILFIDHISKLKRDMIMKKMQKRKKLLSSSAA